MTNKILLSVFCITSVAFCIAIFIAVQRGNTIKNQQEKINNLSANIEILINRSKKEYADKIELAKRNEELEKKAKQDTSCFTWFTDISNSPIVKQLREN